MYVKYVVGAINMFYIYIYYNPISCICFRNKVLCYYIKNNKCRVPPIFSYQVTNVILEQRYNTRKATETKLQMWS